MSLANGDLFQAQLEGATVAWCAIRPVSGRRLAKKLVEQLRSTLPPGGVLRLLLPGFLLPVDSVGTTLRAGYVFATPEQDRATQLYGGAHGGPRAVFDYFIERRPLH